MAEESELEELVDTFLRLVLPDEEVGVRQSVVQKPETETSVNLRRVRRTADEKIQRVLSKNAPSIPPLDSTVSAQSCTSPRVPVLSLVQQDSY